MIRSSLAFTLALLPLLASCAGSSSSAAHRSGRTDDSAVSLAGDYKCGVPTATGGGFQYGASMSVDASNHYTYGSAPSGELQYDAATGAVDFVSGGLSVARNGLYLTTNDRPRIDYYTPDETGTDFILGVCYRSGGGSYPTSPASDDQLVKPTVSAAPAAGTGVELSGTTSGTTDAEIDRSQSFPLTPGDHTLSWAFASTSASGTACSIDLYVVAVGAEPSSGGIDYTGSTAPSSGSNSFTVSTAGDYYVAASGGAGSEACQWSATIR